MRSFGRPFLPFGKAITADGPPASWSGSQSQPGGGTDSWRCL